ncbi:MAG: hypothetical protein Ta2B_14740 [Termitinemataceae bacterium]|nr:MAG: hypothetical protein Ta2B_14740 [Termitinemataceae bacterium]
MKIITLKEETIKNILSLYNTDVQIYWNDFDYIIRNDNILLNISPIDISVESYQNCDEAIIIETDNIFSLKNLLYYKGLNINMNDERITSFIDSYYCKELYYKNVIAGLITSIYSVKTLLYFTKAKKISEQEKELNLKQNNYTGDARRVYEILNSLDVGYNFHKKMPCSMLNNAEIVNDFFPTSSILIHFFLKHYLMASSIIMMAMIYLNRIQSVL